MKKFLITTALTLILAVTTAYASNPIVAGETFYGQCPDTGETIWVKEAPDGLSLADDGSITWPVPLDMPSGTYTFTCKIKEKAGNGKYLFPIEVIGVNTIAEGVIGLSGGDVIAGDVKLTIPCNMVPDGTPISIGTLDGDFPLPFVGADVVKTFSLAPHGIEFTTIPSALPDFTDLVQIKDYIDELKADAVNGIMLSITVASKDYTLITYQPTVAGIMDWRYVPSTITENADGTFTLTAYLQHFSVYSMLYEQQFTHSENWMHELEWASAMERVEALQEVVEVLNTESDHTFTSYLYNAVTPEALGGDKELALQPVGMNDSQTAAFELQFELRQQQNIQIEFRTEVVNTGYIVAGASVPITHYAVKISPINPITGEICSPDCGPAYIVDRYIGQPDMHEIERSYKSDPPNDGPYWHNGIDKFIHGVVQDHFKVDTYDDPAAKIQEIHDDLMSVVPGGGEPDPRENCLIDTVDYVAPDADWYTQTFMGVYPDVPAALEACQTSDIGGGCGTTTAQYKRAFVGNMESGNQRYYYMFVVKKIEASQLRIREGIFLINPLCFEYLNEPIIFECPNGGTYLLPRKSECPF